MDRFESDFEQCNRNLLDLEQKSDRNMKEILQISVQIRCVVSVELEGNYIFFDVMMPKKRWTELNQIWNRNLKYFEQKSERNMCDIFKMLRPPGKIQIFGKFGMLEIIFLFEKSIFNLAEISLACRPP